MLLININIRVMNIKHSEIIVIIYKYSIDIIIDKCT